MGPVFSKVSILSKIRGLWWCQNMIQMSRIQLLLTLSTAEVLIWIPTSVWRIAVIRSPASLAESLKSALNRVSVQDFSSQIMLFLYPNLTSYCFAWTRGHILWATWEALTDWHSPSSLWPPHLQLSSLPQALWPLALLYSCELRILWHTLVWVHTVLLIGVHIINTCCFHVCTNVTFSVRSIRTTGFNRELHPLFTSTNAMMLLNFFPR